MVARAQLDLPTTAIDGIQYYYYQVESGESLYGVSRKIGVSQEVIIKYNPDAANGLKPKSRLLFPLDSFGEESQLEADADGAEAQETVSTVIHTVARGESLAGIARAYNVTPEEIIAANPGAERGLRKGQKLRITVATVEGAGTTATSHTSATSSKSEARTRVKQSTAGGSVTGYYPYRVKSGDTYESIARECGVDEADLRAANPDVRKPKKGKTLYVPVIQPTAAEEDISDAEEEDPSTTTDDAINVALLLPYMLDDASPGQQALLYTEFYKGFLMAVDDVRERTGKPINIYTYDTAGSLSAVNSILARDEMRTMDVIFAPDDTTQLAAVARYGRENGIDVVNAFVIKSDAYASNPNLFQVNVPQADMSRKVTRWIDDNFRGYEIIILSCSDLEDKEVISQIRSNADGKLNWRDFEIATVLSADTLSATLQAGGKYLIVANSGSKRWINRTLPAIMKIKESRLDVDIALMGHPEWITYIDDFGPRLHKIGTYCYSRFFADEESGEMKAFRSAYEGWYGEDMILATPRFGLFGYDAGRYFLQACIDGGAPAGRSPRGSSGLQNGFMFERAGADGGYVNKAVYFMRLRPGDDSVERTMR